MQDLLDEKILKKKIVAAMEPKRLSLRPFEKDPSLDLRTMTEEYLTYGHRLEQHIADTAKLMWELLDSGRRVIFEGAQATMLDIDHGTYPFVTSSNPVAGAACIGAGVGPKDIDEIWGSRQGVRHPCRRGAVPHRAGGRRWATACAPAEGSSARPPGVPRRTGWLDLVALRYAHAPELALGARDHQARRALGPRADQGVHQLPRRRGGGVRQLPLPPDGAAPHHGEVHRAGGLERGDRGVRRASRELPVAAQEYMRFIGEHVGAPVALIGVGPGRDQVMWTEVGRQTLAARNGNSPDRLSN